MFKNSNSGKPIPCFKRWSRTSYGIFVSLHRHVIIGVLSVGMSIILLATTSHKSFAADTVSVFKIQKLDSVDVVGNKKSPTRSAMSQTVFYNKKIEAAAPFQTLESVLRVSPSFDVRERGGKGIQTDISIRGGSFDQTMVMLNGINFTDARTGHQTHSLPIDIDCVSGIELIDGVCGTGAYTGAINFRTQAQWPQYIRAEITGGDHGYFYTNVNGAYSKNGFNILGAASYRRSDGYIHNTDFKNTNAYVRANYENDKIGLIDIQAGFQSRDFGANGFYSLKYQDQYEHTDTWIASARWVKNLGHRFTINAISSYRRNRDRFELIKDMPNKVPFNYHLTDNLGEELWIDYRSIAGTTTIGGDYIYNHIYSTVLGEKLNSPKSSGITQKYPLGNGSFEERKIMYTKGKGRNTANAWLRHVKHFNNFNVAASAGISSTSYGESAIWSISGGYTICDGSSYENAGSSGGNASSHSGNTGVFDSHSGIWTIDAGATQSMRLPTFTDLYYTSKGYVGNPNLKPEKAVTYRIGTRYSIGKITTSLTGYYRTGKDIIDWVKKNPDDDWRSEQLTKLNTLGVEFTARYFSDNGFLRNASVSYGYISTDKKAKSYISKYALDYMRNKASASIQGAILPSLKVTATGTFFDRCGNYSILSSTSATGSETKAYKPYFLLDARVTWEHGPLTIYIDGTNLTSTRYFDYGGLIMPKIWASGGLIITLK